MVTRSTMYSRPSAGWAILSCSTGDESVKDAVDEVSTASGLFQVEVQGRKDEKMQDWKDAISLPRGLETKGYGIGGNMVLREVSPKGRK